MGDTPTIPISGPEWDIDGLTAFLMQMNPKTFVQLHWGLYLLVHVDEHQQVNMSQWLWAWDWLQANDGQELPGLSVTL